MDEIHETVEKTHQRSCWSRSRVLEQLGIPKSTYYGWFGLHNEIEQVIPCHTARGENGSFGVCECPSRAAPSRNGLEDG